MKLFESTEMPITKIYIEDRKRELGDLESLKKSIEANGLLQPIVVSKEGRLLAGERRLTACSQLGFDKISVRIPRFDIGPEDAIMIEMIENIERKEFLWHEEILLKLKLHLLWKAEAEAKKEKWGHRETAKRMQVSLGGISTDLQLAASLNAFPQLIKCETKGKAREMFKKVLQQVDAIESMNALPEEEKAKLKALTQGTTSTKKDAPKKNIPQALREDTTPEIPTVDCSPVEQTDECVSSGLPPHTYKVLSYDEFLPEIPDNSVGLIELDPPYAINFGETYGKTSKIEATAEDWTVDQLYSFYEQTLPILYNKLLMDSWAICWTGKEHWQITNEMAEEAGFSTQPPGVWVKPGGSCNSARTTMVSNYEMFILLRKGKANFNVPSVPSVWHFDPVHTSKRIHQWEKPLNMSQYILKIMGRPKAIFLSLFAGSGNTLIAAAQAGMLPMGCDKAEKYIHLFYKNFRNFYMEDQG